MTLVAQDEWKRALVEPALGAPDVFILAPAPQALKHVLAKMAPHGEHVEIGINMRHTLSLAVDDDAVGAISTEWRGLAHPKYVGGAKQLTVSSDKTKIAAAAEAEDDENGANQADPFALDDADDEATERMTRVYVSKAALNKLLSACEFFSEGGKAHVIL